MQFLKTIKRRREKDGSRRLLKACRFDLYENWVMVGKDFLDMEQYPILNFKFQILN